MRAGISAEEIERLEDRLVFSVRRADAAAVESLLSEQDLSYDRSGWLGAKRTLLALLGRPFLIISILFSAVGVLFLQSFVYGYSIRGNEYVNTETVAAVLRANHADGFAYKKALDLQEIKREIAAIEGVSFASVKVVGNRLEVTVKEELPRETPDEPLYAPVLSECDAIVTKVVAESGTPRVEVGDRVSKGAILIEPIYLFAEGQTEAPARGEVWGRVTYKKELYLPTLWVEKVRTGEFFLARTVTFFGRGIGKEAAPPFADYEWEERVIYRGIGVSVTERAYYRLAEQTLCRDLAQEGESLLRGALADLLLSVSFCATEKSGVSLTQKKVDNIIVLVLYYTVERRIDLP